MPPSSMGSVVIVQLAFAPPIRPVVVSIAGEGWSASKLLLGDVRVVATPKLVSLALTGREQVKRSGVAD